MQPSGGGPIRSTGRRTRSRLRVRLAGRFTTTSGRGDATLIDLSATGAQIWLGKAIKVGSDILLMWHEQEIFGTVVWSSEGRCGVAFEKPLSDEVLAASRGLIDPDAAVEAAKRWVEGSDSARN